MKYVVGNIVELADSGEYDVVVHGCNCFCTMGAGVAKVLAERWPEIREADNRTEKGSWQKLGGFSFDSALTKNWRAIKIVNAYTQYYTANHKDSKPFDYTALREVFHKLSFISHKEDKILIPKIGAGLANGNWELIEEIIDSFGLDVTCCVLEEV